jgi:chorismate synthase
MIEVVQTAEAGQWAEEVDRMSAEGVAVGEAPPLAEVDASGYVMREPHGVEEHAELARVFQAVFKLPDLATPPAWLMEDTTKAGGLTLGLWRGDEAVGVSYAFPGIDAGEPYLYSDGLGVLPEHRARGRAYAMKLAQRDHALRRGIARIVWTFSALRSVNAHLYMSRLGAVGSEYLPDKRGALDTEWGTEGGVPFDEFLVDWQLDSDRVRARLAGRSPAPDLHEIPVVSRCSGAAPEVVLEEVTALPGTDRVAVEVAPDYQALVDRSPLLAHDWRDKTRPLFSTLIDEGYALTECLRTTSSGRVHYVFERGAPA